MKESRDEVRVLLGEGFQSPRGEAVMKVVIMGGGKLELQLAGFQSPRGEAVMKAAVTTKSPWLMAPVSVPSRGSGHERGGNMLKVSRRMTFFVSVPSRGSGHERLRR